MGHFYSLEDDGVIKPRHFTSYAKPRIVNGREVLRASTVGDLRKWLKNGEKCAASVTTILDVLAKPALVNWQIDRHLEQVYDKGVDLLKQDSFDSFKKEVKRLAQEQMDKAPKAGTDFHNSMDLCVQNILDEDVGHYDLCQKVINLIEDKSEITYGKRWRPEVNIFSELGYAGQADLILEGEAETWIIDYKTKETAAKFKPKKMHYDNHAQQLAAYGFDVDTKFRAANIFVCLETGELDWHEWKQEDLTRGFEVFMSCLNIYYIINKLYKER